MQDILLSPISLESLIARIREVVKDELIAAQPKDEQLISVDEARKLFSPVISRPTLHAWTKKGLIPSHILGGRVFYKKSEVLGSAKEVKRYSKV